MIPFDELALLDSFGNFDRDFMPWIKELLQDGGIMIVKPIIYAMWGVVSSHIKQQKEVDEWALLWANVGKQCLESYN